MPKIKVFYRFNQKRVSSFLFALTNITHTGRQVLCTHIFLTFSTSQLCPRLYSHTLNRLPFFSHPLPYAPCPLRYALCPMLYALSFSPSQPLTFSPSFFSAFRIPNSHFSFFHPPHSEFPLQFFPTSAFPLPTSTLIFFFSAFRIFSRGIVPPYRTTTGPNSDFKRLSPAPPKSAHFHDAARRRRGCNPDIRTTTWSAQ
jgi:hypothetical protein